MQVDLQKLLDKADYSAFKLVILASKRALQLTAGAPKLTEADPEDAKPIAVALKEIEEGAVTMRTKK